MSAIKAGHLRNALVAAVRLVGGSEGRMRPALGSIHVDFPPFYPLLSVRRCYRILHNPLDFMFPHGGAA